MPIIINRTRLGVKMGLTGEPLYADYAVPVPDRLKKLPLKVFATSSIDALVHAVESSLSPKATAYTKLIGYKAIEIIIGDYRKLARDDMEQLSARWHLPCSSWGKPLCALYGCFE